jgi:hypothetical protein
MRWNGPNIRSAEFRTRNGDSPPQNILEHRLPPPDCAIHLPGRSSKTLAGDEQFLGERNGKDKDVAADIH